MDGIYPGVAGSFVADGTIRAFTTVRNKPTGGIDVGFSLGYSEMYNPTTNAIMVANANTLWRLGIKNVATGAIYWVKNGSANGDIAQAPAGNYVIVCKSDQARPTTTGYARIRFSGLLTLR